MTRILVIEDDAHTQKIIKTKLYAAGYEVAIIGDGSGVLEYLTNNQVDLVILDLLLPLASGKELLITLRENVSTKYIPVIILTIKGLEKDVTELLSLGADDYVRKPFSPAELVARVQNLLRKPRE